MDEMEKSKTELLNQLKEMNVSSDNLDWVTEQLDQTINEEVERQKEETYSIPIYENGVKTEWSVDGIVGDEKYQQLIKMSPEGKLPDMINTTTKQ